MHPIMLTIQEFLDYPIERIRPLAPETVAYAASGTRRSAVRAGISLRDDDYARWNHVQMIRSCEIIFDHGVKDIITILATPDQFREHGFYGERLLHWIEWGVVSSQAREEFAKRGWNVRIISDPSVPRLLELDTVLRTQNDGSNVHTLWCVAINDVAAQWSNVLQSVIDARATTHEDAICAAYHANLAPVDLFLGFGKPIVADPLVPPLLAGDMNCYWSQKPGYSLDNKEWRSILYDYRYQRPVHEIDRQRRAEQVVNGRDDWDQTAILGLGEREGSYWRPVDLRSQRIET